VLLRRVSIHIREQNWFAVVIDFVIVVVGVFIGIQAANWNEVQEDRRLGRDYTERLITDLEDDLAVSATLFSYYKQVLENVEETDKLLRAPNPDSQAVVVAAYRASEFANSPTNSATWDLGPNCFIWSYWLATKLRRRRRIAGVLQKPGLGRCSESQGPGVSVPTRGAVTHPPSYSARYQRELQ